MDIIHYQTETVKLIDEGEQKVEEKAEEELFQEIDKALDEKLKEFEQFPNLDKVFETSEGKKYKITRHTIDYSLGYLGTSVLVGVCVAICCLKYYYSKTN